MHCVASILLTHKMGNPIPGLVIIDQASFAEDKNRKDKMTLITIEMFVL